MNSKNKSETTASLDSPLTKSAEDKHIFKDHKALEAYAKDIVNISDAEDEKKKQREAANKEAVNAYLSVESKKRR